MLKSLITSLAGPVQSVYNVSAGPASVQSVRWRRKPRWIPTAKSKMFKVPERKHEDPEERSELMRLHQNYKTQIRAIRSYLIEEVRVQKLTSSADHLVVSPEEELAEFEASNALNASWNSQIAAERKLRLDQQLADRKEYILSRLELKEERDQLAREQAEETVRREKILSKTYILKENLDQAIEHALANPVDYNFAIDLQHNILSGRVTDTSSAASVATENEVKALSS